MERVGGGRADGRGHESTVFYMGGESIKTKGSELALGILRTRCHRSVPTGCLSPLSVLFLCSSPFTSQSGTTETHCACICYQYSIKPNKWWGDGEGERKKM
jgi:hypothetical protein